MVQIFYYLYYELQTMNLQGLKTYCKQVPAQQPPVWLAPDGFRRWARHWPMGWKGF